MLAFPNAKINLGLRVLTRLPNGYHEISSCLYPVPWRDVLEIVPSKKFNFEQTGLVIPGKSDTNLCVRAYEVLKNDMDLPNVSMHLHKVVPMGAGLGGGSADGAFTIKLLNAVFQLELSVEEMQKYAAILGSDCPFFIENKPALVMGTGTETTTYDISLSGYWLALKHPGIHISTATAYAGVKPGIPDIELTEVLKYPIGSWKNHLINDFEESVFPENPEIKEIKADLYEKGALYASMSGSGSAVYGLFSERPSLEGFEVFQLG